MTPEPTQRPETARERVSCSLSTCHGPGSLLELFVRILCTPPLSLLGSLFCREVYKNQSYPFFSTRAF